MRRVVSLACILICAPAVAGKRFVEVSRPSASGHVSTVTWEEGSPDSDLVLRDGVSFKALEADGVTVVTSVHDVGKRFRVDIFVANQGEERFEVYPERVTFIMTSPKDKALEYVPMEKLARSIKRKAAWTAALAGMNANATETISTTTHESGSVSMKSMYGTSTTGAYSGSSLSTSQVPNHEARAASREAVRQIHEQASAELARLEDVALQANTLLPGEEVLGSVFFMKNENIRAGWLTVPAGARAFSFPVMLTRSKN